MHLERKLTRLKLPGADVLGGMVLWGLMFLVYLRTLAPGVYGFDSAELATGVFAQGIIHPPGYPLYLLIGRLFSLLPVGDIAYRLNIMSAFFGALTVVLLFSLGVLLTGRAGPAWVSAAILGFSVYFWQMSIVAEVYTLHTALLAGTLLLALIWRRTGWTWVQLLFAFLYGLSLSNHTSSLLFAPGLVWIIIRSNRWEWKRWGRSIAMFGGFLLGLSPYLYLAVRAQAGPLLNYVATSYDVDLTSWRGLFWMMSGQAYRFFSFGYALPELPSEILRFGSFLSRSFVGVGVPLGVFGLVRGLRRDLDVFVGLLVSFLATAIFYVNYRVADKDTMFLAAYLLWAVFLLEGFLYVEHWLRTRGASEIWAKARFVPVLVFFLVFLPAPILNWRWVDMHDANAFSRYARTVLSASEPNALVIAPWSQAVVLEYFQVVEGQRPDIKVVNSSRMNVAIYYELWSRGYGREEILRIIAEKGVALINDHIGTRPVYSLDYDATLSAQYEYMPDGVFFRLAPRESAS